jgi:hypothetical protein
MAGIPIEKKTAFKQVKFTDTLVKLMLEKIVYNGNKLMMFVNIADTSYLADFKGIEINQANEPMKGYYISDDGKHAIIEKQVFLNQLGTNTNRYIGRGTTILTKAENAANLIRALAYGWHYKKLYESGTPVQEIEKQEKIAHRTIYKYLNLAYLSPKITTAIMESTIPPYINLQTLFGIASKYDGVKEQKKVFFEIK